MAETPDENQAQIMKGKRTKRSRPPSVSSASSAADCSSSSAGLAGEGEQDQDLANCLMLLAQGRTRTGACSSSSSSPVLVPQKLAANQSLFLYQCKTCDRYFPSFQALGGHRASHKKPKFNNIVNTSVQQPQQHPHFTPSDSIQLSLQLSTTSRPPPPPPPSAAVNDLIKPKVHECSICGAEFSSGQALGGHMRRHRALTANPTRGATTTTTTTPKLQDLMTKKKRNMLELDLNLPAPEEDRHRPPIAVFSSASPLVDCHY